jgi:hypothetical protein
LRDWRREEREGRREKVGSVYITVIRMVKRKEEVGKGVSTRLYLMKDSYLISTTAHLLASWAEVFPSTPASQQTRASNDLTKEAHCATQEDA